MARRATDANNNLAGRRSTEPSIRCRHASSGKRSCSNTTWHFAGRRRASFADIFLGIEAFPLTSIGRWLLDDLGAPATPQRDEAESHLLVTAVYVAARAHLIEAILDPSSFVSREHVALITVLSERLTAELAAIVPAGAPFWELRKALSEDDLEAMLDARERREAWRQTRPCRTTRSRCSGPHGRDRPACWRSLRWHLARQVPTVRTALEADVGAMLDALAEAVQIRDDLATMQRDLEDGRLSFPIAVDGARGGAAAAAVAIIRPSCSAR